MALNDKTISRLIKSGIIILLLAIILSMIYVFFDILLIFTISVLVAFIFNPLTDKLEKYGMPRILAVLSVFIVSGFIIFLGFSFLIPKIGSQLNTLSMMLNDDSLGNFFTKFQDFIKAYVPFISASEITDKLSSIFTALIYDSIADLQNILNSIFTIVAIAIIVPFIAFFILKDKRTLLKGLVDIMPNKYFEMAYNIIRKINKQLGLFVRAWIFDALIVGTLCAVGLALIGIDNAASIGLVAGLGHLIPYFGPVIGGIPALLISVIQFGDFSMLPKIALMFTIIYTFDNGYIQPNLFGKSTSIHPLLIILLILMGGQILGIPGMLLAVPTATVIKTAAKEIYNGFKNYKISKI